MSDHVVYSHTVRALVENVLTPRGLLDTAFRAELKALGIDPQRPHDISSSTWWKLLQRAGARLSPAAPPDVAMEALGRAMVLGYGQTFLGKSTFVVLRLLGPRRALARLTDQFRATNTSLEVKSRELAPTDFEVSIHTQGGGPAPGYAAGILVEGLRQVGAPNPRVELVTTNELETVMRVRWG